jgi:hypothetical protein
MTRRIAYNNAADTQRFEFPSDWRTPTGVTISIATMDGTTLLAATATTIYTATTTNGAVNAGDTTIVIDGASAMASGDRFRISKTGEAAEDVEVLSFVTGTKTATLRHALDYGHADESVVSALWCTYDLATTTTATWTPGLRCIVTWTPNTDDPPYVEDAIVLRYSGLEVPAWRERFRARYPVLFSESVDRLDQLYDDARDQVEMDVRAMERDIRQLREPGYLSQLIIPLLAYYLARNEGAGGESEATAALAEYQRALETLSRPALWIDADQDLLEEEEEGEVTALQWRPLGPGRMGPW